MKKLLFKIALRYLSNEQLLAILIFRGYGKVTVENKDDSIAMIAEAYKSTVKVDRSGAITK